MALSALVLAWALVTVWFCLWDVLAAPLTPSDGPQRGSRWLPAHPGVYFMEAGLLTLLAGLWFASLGAGTWVPIFILVGLLTEWSSRVRDATMGAPWRRRLLALGLGTVRTVVAGGVLAWRLS